MVRAYWKAIGYRAAKDTLHAFSLDSVEKIFIAIAVGVIGLLFLWATVDAQTSTNQIYVRAIATGAALILWPAVFLWKLIRTPAILDREKAAAVATLQQAADRRESISKQLGELTKELYAGQRLCNRPIGSDEELAKWQEEINTWLTNTHDDIKRIISPTTANTFLVITSYNSVSISRSHNTEHETLLTKLQIYVERVRNIIQDYDFKNQTSVS